MISSNLDIRESNESISLSDLNTIDSYASIDSIKCKKTENVFNSMQNCLDSRKLIGNNAVFEFCLTENDSRFNRYE